MKTENLTIPGFILCENPIKAGDNLDHRSWIYCPAALSLIEVFPEKITVAINRELVQKKFIYENTDLLPEEFTLVIVQNNCETLNLNPVNLLNQAWEWYKIYLHWEDQNIDQSQSSKKN